MDYWIYFILFGLPSWVLVDGTWSILASLALVLPEGYTISSFLTIALTLGNVVPLALGFALRNSNQQKVYQIVLFVLAAGIVTGILMSLLWNVSVQIGNCRYSIPLYVLFFIVGSCSAASNVTHFMFVSPFQSSCTTLLSTGMAIGSMIAGVLGLLQGMILWKFGFSVSCFYGFLSSLYLVAIVCYYELNKHSQNFIQSSQSKEEMDEDDPSLEGFSLVVNDIEADGSEYDDPYAQDNILSEYRFYLALHFLNAFFGYGIVPSIISITCNRFSQREQILLISTTIACCLDPLGRAATHFFRIRSREGFLLSSVVISSLGTVLFLLSLIPNRTSFSGWLNALPPILYITSNVTFGFANTCMFRHFKDIVPHCSIHHAYRFCGIAQQAGALVGSLFVFTLVLAGVTM